MTPDQIELARKVADHASNQSPNWWLALIALVALFLVVGGVIRGAKWIVARHEALTKDLAESNAEQVKILTGVVEKNTTAWIENKLDVGSKLQGIDGAIRELTTEHRMSLRREQAGKAENHG